MKMASKVMPAIMLLFIFIGCATQNIQVTDQVGRQLPTPHYMLKTIDNNIQVLYYWAYHIDDKKDLDGTPISQPIFFDYMKNNGKTIPSNVKAITLTLEILNVKQERYELWERTLINDRNGNFSSKGGIIGFSNQRYRQFVLTLPYSPDLTKVEFAVDFVDSTGMPILRFGEYEYKVYSNMKGGVSF